MIKRTINVQEQRERLRQANIARCSEQGRISLGNARTWLRLLAERLDACEREHLENPGNWGYLGEIQDIEAHLAQLIPIEYPEDSDEE